MYDDVHLLRNSLIDRIKLEENLQNRNRELENELFKLRSSRGPVIAYKVEKITEYIPKEENSAKREEKVKKAHKGDTEEILRLRTEIRILQEELDKERKGPNYDRLLKELYEKLCGLSEDFRGGQEKAREIEQEVKERRERQRERKMDRINRLGGMIENLRRIGNKI